jgi:FkbM family methyltransferase
MQGPSWMSKHIQQAWRMLPLGVRAKAKQALRVGIKALPPSMCGYAVSFLPPVLNVLPERKTIKFPKYLGEFTVLVDTIYPIEREMLSGTYDPFTTEILHRFVKRGDICFDIGANVGALSLAMAQQTGPKGKVYAFEPGPPLFDRLITNINLNPTLGGCIVPVQVGISDAQGLLHWSEDMNNRGNASLLDSDPDGIEVPVLTLDQYCDAHKVTRLSFIKVDVEGMEYEVFKGANMVLKNLRPILYFETLPFFTEYKGFDVFAEIECLLRDVGYSLFKILPDRTITRTTAKDLSWNTLAFPVGDGGLMNLLPNLPNRPC